MAEGADRRIGLGQECRGILEGSGECKGPPDAVTFLFPEETIMEWAVRDINGDGYPDVLFNSAPVVVESTDEPPPKFLPPPGRAIPKR